jgi:spermidine synthase
MSLKVERVLEHLQSDFQDILVVESTNYGKVLILDGVIQVTERDEFAYQEMMVHIPLLAHPNPLRVLCIGGGDGGVVREIARHASVQEIVLCEIDQKVMDVSKKYLPSLACGMDDPRVTVHVGDGAQFLADHVNAFDVIITDSSDPVGPASVLFETPFYNAMYASLREGGIVCTQGECTWLHLHLIRPLMDAIRTTYSTVEYAYTSLPTYPCGQIGFIIATKGRETGCRVPCRKLDDAVQQQLRCYTPELHQAAFCLPAFAQRAIFE